MSPDTQAARPPLPAISVVVPSRLGATWLTTCLDSLVDQDLAEPYEVVVVQYGADDGTAAAVAELEHKAGPARLRHLRSEAPTRAAAKNAGLAETTAPYLVFVQDEDRVSRSFLSGLLGAAEPDGRIVVPLCVSDPGDRPADFRGRAARRLLAHAGTVVSPRRLAPALASTGGGIAYPRRQLLACPFDADLVIGEDAVLLARLLADPSLVCAIPPADAGAVYYRAVRRNHGHPSVEPGQLLDGIERLTGLPLPEDREPLRRELLAAATTELNRYLQNHADDHATVIQERRRRGLTDVLDLRRLNHRVARDLAVVYTAVPYVDTSANVAARRVLARQRIVDVVSNDMGGRLSTDPSSDAIWAEFVDRRVVLDARPADIWWPGVTEFCHKGLAEITALERAKGPYRSVYSRAMHPTSHFLAAWLKLRRPELTWYAEFSDPMRHTVQGEERPSSGQQDPVIMTDLRAGLAAAGFAAPETDNLFTWLETITYALADEITFTNENQRGFMLERFPDDALRARAATHSVVSHHPVPPTRFYRTVTSDYELPNGKVNLAYFGVFYATRGLSEVWQALRRLPRAARQSLVLHVFTSKPDELSAELADAGLADVVRANPYVSYLEYLNLASRMDVLIVNDARTIGIHDRNPYLPSKWSDYSGSGSAVWGIVEPGSVLSGQPLDHRSELGDADGALRVLADLARGRRQVRPPAPATRG